MRELLTIQQAEGRLKREKRPQLLERISFVIDKARKRNDPRSRVLRIVWDRADGYPEHAWGYEQWSVRPFIQGQGCDGTIDNNVHAIGYLLCKERGLDYETLYDQAYPDERGNRWLRQFIEQELPRVLSETIVPELSPESWANLIDDLHDINNHSLAGVLYELSTQPERAVLDHR